jgi:putative salt-induced outer membrane protein
MRGTTMATGAAMALMACSTISASAQAPKEKPVKFTGDIGFVNTAGNTSVTTLTVGDKLTARTGRVLFTQVLALVYGKNEGVENANSQQVRGRGDYSLTARLSGYGFVGYERDKFAGISHRTDEGVGLAFAAWRDSSNELDVEGGAGLVQETRFLTPPAGPTSADNFVSGRAALRYKHAFTRNTYFQQSLEYLPNLETTSDYRINSESALVAPISAHIGLKMAYQVKYNHLPLQTIVKRTDRLFTTGLQITF